MSYVCIPPLPQLHSEKSLFSFLSWGPSESLICPQDAGKACRWHAWNVTYAQRAIYKAYSTLEAIGRNYPKLCFFLQPCMHTNMSTTIAAETSQRFISSTRQPASDSNLASSLKTSHTDFSCTCIFQLLTPCAWRKLQKQALPLKGTDFFKSKAFDELLEYVCNLHVHMCI